METVIKNEPRIKVKGNGMDGKIIVKAHRFYKEIPVVLFSSKEANTLLRLVDKMESERQKTIIHKGKL